MSSPEKVTWYSSLLTSFLAGECVEAVGHPAAFARDCQTVARRVAAEGEGFLTKTLPAFGKAIDLALAGNGPLRIPGFKKCRGRSAIPAFLQGLLLSIFSLNGDVLDAPCITSIRLLRQACFWFYKMERGYDEESLRLATRNLIEVDAALPDVGVFDRRKDLVLAQALVTVAVKDFNATKLMPKHGPGAVAGGEGTVEKREVLHRYRNLERMFRPVPFFFSLRDISEDYTRLTDRIVCEYGLSRLAFVNKDSRGPRVISLETTEYQFVQQALKRAMYRILETGRLTAGHINFTDQTVNRHHACLWEEDDTLDMKEASDRNSLALVEFLFRKTKILPYLLASRSPGTVLPSGEILWFKKFAPMGSATCFPVQALVYWALAVTALRHAGMPLHLALRKVYVYGDDLIVPHGYFDAIQSLFESVALKFNSAKCCIAGKFRESCGLDAYDGVDVSPLRLKHSDLTTSSIMQYEPLIAHANGLWLRGYRTTAVVLRKYIQAAMPVKIPLSTHNLPILHFLDDVMTAPIREVNSITEVYGWSASPVKVEAPRSCDWRILRESLSLGGPVGEEISRTVKTRHGTEHVVRDRVMARRYAVQPQKKWHTCHLTDVPALSDEFLKKLVAPQDTNWANQSCSLPHKP